MTRWLLPLGFTIYEIGVARQLAADWRRHGLTYFHYSTLACLILGRVCMAAGALALGMPVLALVSGVPMLASLIVLGLKLRDRTRRWW